MFPRRLIIAFGVIVSILNILGEICHLASPDVTAEVDAALVVLQGVALNNATSNVSEDTDLFNIFQGSSNRMEIGFSVIRILKGKWRIPNIQVIKVMKKAVMSQDPCGSAITVGVKYLIFLKNSMFTPPRNFSSPVVTVMSPENVNLILVSSLETISLVTHRNTKIKPGRPTATLTEPELSVSSGMRIRLVCRTSGYPVPVVKWFKNKVLLFPDVHFKFSNRRYESELLISYAEPGDSGIYKCQASNRFGKSRYALASVYVTGANSHRRRFFGTRCTDEAFCFNNGRCFQSYVLGYRFCVCSSEFTGIRCSVRKNQRPSYMKGVKETEPEDLHYEVEVVVIVVAIFLLISVSLVIMIAILARKLCCSYVEYVESPDEKSLKQISPQLLVRSQVEVTNLVFAEQTSESSVGENDSKRSFDLSTDVPPLYPSAKPEANTVESGFNKESAKSVTIELEDDSDPEVCDYDLSIAQNLTFDSDNSDCAKWCTGNRLSDLEVHRESDVDMVEVEPSGDELFCPSRGLSEMSSRCDTSSRTSTSMDCESTSSADLSQRLLRQLYAFPQIAANEEEEGKEEDLSLEEFLGQHCITMGALPNLKDYLGMLEIDESLAGSYTGSRNQNSCTPSEI